MNAIVGNYLNRVSKYKFHRYLRKLKNGNQIEFTILTQGFHELKKKRKFLLNFSRENGKELKPVKRSTSVNCLVIVSSHLLFELFYFANTSFSFAQKWIRSIKFTIQKWGRWAKDLTDFIGSLNSVIIAYVNR